MTALPSIDQMNDWNTANNGLGVTEAQWRALFAQFYAFVQENQGSGSTPTIYTADGDIQSTRLIGLNGNTVTFRQTYSGTLYDTGIGGDGFYASGQEDFDALGSTYYSFFAGAGVSYYANIISSVAEGSRQHIAIFKNDKVTENFEGTISQVQSLGGDIETYPHDVGAGTLVGKEGELISYANSSQDGGIYTQIREYPTETIIDSNFSGYAGLKYANDHSANFTDRSLIDKGFVNAVYLKIVDAPAPMPVGMVAEFSATSAPSGWLNLDGSELGRAIYPDLFAVIGETFGAGDGTTTFLIDDRPHADTRMIYMIKI